MEMYCVICQNKATYGGYNSVHQMCLKELNDKLAQAKAMIYGWDKLHNEIEICRNFDPKLCDHLSEMATKFDSIIDQIRGITQ